MGPLFYRVEYVIVMESKLIDCYTIIILLMCHEFLYESFIKSRFFVSGDLMVQRWLEKSYNRKKFLTDLTLASDLSKFFVSTFPSSIANIHCIPQYFPVNQLHYNYGNSCTTIK